MSETISRIRTVRWILLLATCFALAACASQSSTGPEGTSQAQSAQSGQSDSAGTSGSSATDSGTAGTADTADTSDSQQDPRSGSAMTPLGDRVEIRRPWVQVRAEPNANARAIALAFGNDQLAVVETQGDWVHVRLDRRRDGWIPVSATQAE